MTNLIDLAEKSLFPDIAVRLGIKNLLKKRLSEYNSKDLEGQNIIDESFRRHMKESPLAIHTDAANSQHYEVPSRFYQLCLGKHLKYSSCFFKNKNNDLDTAEHDMLALTCERAEIKDGMRILELGCGWGSLSLWLAKNFPIASITSVSNSHSQRSFIEGEARKRGLSNLQVITCDMNDFNTDQQFDRVVSVEMFEHMRNFDLLFRKISGWLTSDGKLFFHIFCHAQYAYPFETEGDDNWMGRHFFTGGMMPSFSLPMFFQENLSIEQSWKVSGQHYALTSEAWLQNLDRNRIQALRVLKDANPNEQPEVLVQRWRIFFMACAELFAYDAGKQWFVGHYLFKNKNRS